MALHDIAPPFERDVIAQLEALDALGIEKLVLKVVPRWHGNQPISDSPRLCAALASRAADGSQLVLHGLEHRPRGTWRGPALRQLRARLFAPGAAEFMTLSAREAAESVRQGRDELRAAGLPEPGTFCAPGWLISREARAGVAEAGIRYLSSMTGIEDLREGSVRRLTPLGYMGVAGAEEGGVRLLNSVLAPTAGYTAGVKIYLHPDPSGRRQWQRAVDVAGRYLLAGWRPATLQDVI
jgi:predicted deacetylase